MKEIAQSSAINRKCLPNQGFTDELALTHQQASLLGMIGRNTRSSADDLKDFATHALGGGNLGRIGVTPVEMNATRNQSFFTKLGSSWRRLSSEAIGAPRGAFLRSAGKGP